MDPFNPVSFNNTDEYYLNEHIVHRSASSTISTSRYPPITANCSARAYLVITGANSFYDPLLVSNR